MHELSIVMSIVDIATQQAAQEHAAQVDEIEIDIGCLSTVEMNAFEFAWSQAVKETVLDGTVKRVNRLPGLAKCSDCNTEFRMENLYDACPACNGHLIHVLQGKELRVKSMVVSGNTQHDTSNAEGIHP